MPKRFAGDGTLEAYYVRRVLNEVDICNHLGRWAMACRSRVLRARRLHGRQACGPVCAHRQHTLAGLWRWLAPTPRLHSLPRQLTAAHPVRAHNAGPSTCATCTKCLRTTPAWTW